MQYYKVIIADDELSIRSGLVHNVDWNAMGYQVVADVMDGQDVIDYLQRESVDVIFTDVQMCQVSGLEVARWARENRPEIKVVIISGYKEFEYVKTAMDLKVCDYVLKPINVSELEQTFCRVREELDEGQRRKQQKESIFAYQQDENCAYVLQLEGPLLEAIQGGCPDKTGRTCKAWRLAVEKADRQYIPILVFHVMEELYRQLEKGGVFLGGEFEKNAVLREIGTLESEMLLERVVDMVEKIAGHIAGKKSTASEDVIRRAIQYIDQNLSENFGVESLATHLYLNRTYFSKEFKNYTGMSVMDYIIHRRMGRAAELIREGRLSAEQIAARVGYEDVKYFQRSFKKHTGYTVREYRNLLR